MIDVVIPLGTGSKHNNMELKFALRSVEKHLRQVGRLWIIGESPEFCRRMSIHVPHTEPVNHNHNENIRQKLLDACQIELIISDQEVSVSPDFLYMNDDHFLLKDFTLPDFPNFYKGTLKEYEATNNGWYLADMIHTEKKLPEGALNFDTHTPIMINKAQFIERLGPVEPVGILVKSMYAAGLPGVLEPDCKLYRNHTRREIEHKVKDAPCFSISDRAINDELLKFLNYLYPTKSRWEI